MKDDQVEDGSSHTASIAAFSACAPAPKGACSALAVVAVHRNVTHEGGRESKREARQPPRLALSTTAAAATGERSRDSGKSAHPEQAQQDQQQPIPAMGGGTSAGAGAVALAVGDTRLVLVRAVAGNVIRLPAGPARILRLARLLQPLLGQRARHLRIWRAVCREVELREERREGAATVEWADPVPAEHSRTECVAASHTESVWARRFECVGSATAGGVSAISAP
jgi:hypothetical protein